MAAEMCDLPGQSDRETGVHHPMADGETAGMNYSHISPEVCSACKTPYERTGNGDPPSHGIIGKIRPPLAQTIYNFLNRPAAARQGLRGRADLGRAGGGTMASGTGI